MTIGWRLSRNSALAQLDELLADLLARREAGNAAGRTSISITR